MSSRGAQADPPSRAVVSMEQAMHQPSISRRTKKVNESDSIISGDESCVSRVKRVKRKESTSSVSLSQPHDRRESRRRSRRSTRLDERRPSSRAIDGQLSVPDTQVPSSRGLSVGERSDPRD